MARGGPQRELLARAARAEQPDGGQHREESRDVELGGPPERVGDEHGGPDGPGRRDRAAEHRAAPFGEGVVAADLSLAPQLHRPEREHQEPDQACGDPGVEGQAEQEVGQRGDRERSQAGQDHHGCGEPQPQGPGEHAYLQQREGEPDHGGEHAEDAEVGGSAVLKRQVSEVGHLQQGQHHRRAALADAIEDRRAADQKRLIELGHHREPELGAEPHLPGETVGDEVDPDEDAGSAHQVARVVLDKPGVDEARFRLGHAGSTKQGECHVDGPGSCGVGAGAASDRRTTRPR